MDYCVCNVHSMQHVELNFPINYHNAIACCIDFSKAIIPGGSQTFELGVFTSLSSRDWFNWMFTRHPQIAHFPVTQTVIFYDLIENMGKMLNIFQQGHLISSLPF